MQLFPSCSFASSKPAVLQHLTTAIQSCHLQDEGAYGDLAMRHVGGAGVSQALDHNRGGGHGDLQAGAGSTLGQDVGQRPAQWRHAGAGSTMSAGRGRPH